MTLPGSAPMMDALSMTSQPIFERYFSALYPERFLEDRQDGRQGLDVDDAGLGAVDVVLSAHGVAELEEFAYHLDAGKAGAGDDEGEHALADGGIGLLGGPREDILDMVPDLHRVVEGPEAERIVLDSGDVEVLGLRAGADDDVVELVAASLADSLPGLEIDRLDVVEHDIDTSWPRKSS